VSLPLMPAAPGRSLPCPLRKALWCTLPVHSLASYMACTVVLNCGARAACSCCSTSPCIWPCTGMSRRIWLCSRGIHVVWCSPQRVQAEFIGQRCLYAAQLTAWRVMCVLDLSSVPLMPAAQGRSLLCPCTQGIHVVWCSPQRVQAEFI
jgi:hypothetical protein